MGDAAYLRWLRACGVELNGVTLANFGASGGRGVAATRPLAAGEVLVSVPDSLVLLAESCEAAPALRRAGLLAEDAAPRTQREALVLALLTEQAAGAASRWAPYLAALPPAEELHVPCLWSDAERARLAGTSCGSRLEGGASALRDELPCATTVAWQDAGCPLADEEPELGLLGGAEGEAAHAHATALVAAYSFTLGEGGEAVQGLVPFWDALNHTHPSGASVALSHDPEAGRLNMVCTRPHAAGEQVWNSYGPLGDSELVRRYGFAMGDNPHDACVLRRSRILRAAALTVGQDVVRRRIRLLAPWLRRLLARGSDAMRVCADGRAAPGLLLALRLLLCSDVDAFAARCRLRAGAPPPRLEPASSAELDSCVRRALAALAAIVLQELRQPKFLRSEPLSAHRTSLAAAARRSEARCASALARRASSDGRLPPVAVQALWRRAARQVERRRVLRSRSGSRPAPPDVASLRTIRSLALAGLLTTAAPRAKAHASCAEPGCQTCLDRGGGGPFRLR